MSKVPFALLALGVAAAAQSRADITPVSPFIGVNSESFESFSIGYIDDGASILQGTATVSSLYGDLYVFGPGGFGDGNTYVVPADGSHALGLNSSDEAFTIDFNSPVNAFGGYFTGDTDSVNFSDVVTFTFSDGSTSSFDYTDQTGIMDWIGFTSTVGLTSVSIAGDYVTMDDLQAGIATAAPDSASTAILFAAALGGVLVTRRLTRVRS